MSRGWPERFGRGGLIVLVHALLAFALLRHAGMPQRGAAPPPADYMLVSFIAAPKPAPAARTEPLPVTVPRKPAPRAAPRAEPQRVTAPTPVAPQAPVADAPAATARRGSIDMESLRMAAREVDSARGMDPPQRLRAMDDTALSRAVQQAKRPDCQTKYAGGEAANILLLIPLAIETITDKGCKW